MGASVVRAQEPDWSEDQTDELLSYNQCDSLTESSTSKAIPKAYNALLPQDVLVRLGLYGLLIAAAIALLFALPSSLDAMGHVPHHLKHGHADQGGWWHVVFGAAVVFCIAWISLLLLHIPRRVVREADALVFKFFLHQHTVRLKDVNELVVLSNGRQWNSLLRRWRVFPHGSDVRCFLGARSNNGKPVCVLLARRMLWSFVFTLEDPIQFLLDNQRPLDLEATFRTTKRAVLRQEEGTSTKKLADVPKGRLMKVEEQRGRRVLVRVVSTVETDPEVRGWMSYISSKGVALLTKERPRDGPAPGTCGASELSRLGGSESLELGLSSSRFAGVE